MCEIYEELKRKGLNVDMFSASNQDKHKLKIIQKLKNKELDILVSTIAFGIGLDIGNIRSVIVYYAPESISTIAQLFGRGGRDGGYCRCYLIYSPLESISEEVKSFLLSSKCFRKQFFDYFQVEEIHQASQCCSNCVTSSFKGYVFVDQTRKFSVTKEELEKELKLKQLKDFEFKLKLLKLREELTVQRKAIFQFYGEKLFSELIIDELVQDPKKSKNLPKFIRKEVEKIVQLE